MGLVPTFPGNPRQKHQFNVMVDGFESAWFEKAKLPDVEAEIDEFNPAGSVRATKFAGRFKVGDVTLEKGMKADEADMYSWNWLTQAVNTKTGERGDPKSYKKDVEIAHIDRLGNVVQRFTLKGAFCSKISWSDNEGGSSDHMIESITLTVDDMEVSG